MFTGSAVYVLGVKYPSTTQHEVFQRQQKSNFHRQKIQTLTVRLRLEPSRLEPKRSEPAQRRGSSRLAALLEPCHSAHELDQALTT